MKSRYSFFTVLFFLLAPSMAVAADKCDSAVMAAEYFYEHAYDFNYHPSKALLTDEFQGAVKRELLCASRHGVCILNYDPWTGSQDSGEILQGSEKFELEDGALASAAESSVRMTFTFALRNHDTQKLISSEQVKIGLKLRKEPAACWKIHNVIDLFGTSLLDAFSGITDEWINEPSIEEVFRSREK